MAWKKWQPPLCSMLRAPSRLLPSTSQAVSSVWRWTISVMKGSSAWSGGFFLRCIDHGWLNAPGADSSGMAAEPLRAKTTRGVSSLRQCKYSRRLMRGRSMSFSTYSFKDAHVHESLLMSSGLPRCHIILSRTCTSPISIRISNMVRAILLLVNCQNNRTSPALENMGGRKGPGFI